MGILGTDDLDPVNNPDDVETEVRAGIVGAWRSKAEDPNDQPEQWLKAGAPGGIREHPIPRGVFPGNEQAFEDVDDPEKLCIIKCNDLAGYV